MCIHTVSFCVCVLQFRLLFHGRIQLLTKAATIVLPATFDPCNTVSYIELLLGNLQANLVTNGTLDCMYIVYIHCTYTCVTLTLSAARYCNILP